MVVAGLGGTDIPRLDVELQHGRCASQAIGVEASIVDPTNAVSPRIVPKGDVASATITDRFGGDSQRTNELPGTPRSA
jgi:hypothetical protein